MSNPAFQPPPFSTTIDASVLTLSAVDPNLSLPFTLNVDQNGSVQNGQDPLYAVGGPCSAQFTLKLIF